MKLRVRDLQSVHPSRLFWGVAILALVSVAIYLPRSPLPWFDETYYASAALARLRGGPAVPSIYAAFPHLSSIDRLYGPLISTLGSIQLRIFGLSAVAWRLLSFWGALGAVISAFWVSRILNPSTTAAAAAAMMVALSQGVGARATSGRLDTITVALELLSLGCVLSAFQLRSGKWACYLYAASAGLLCGLAALSTPRSFPFTLGLFLALILESAVSRELEVATRGLVIAVATLIPVWGWTSSNGMSPIRWVALIASLSRGDKINVSPLLHGSWQLFSGPMMPMVSGLLVIITALAVWSAAWIGGVRLHREKNELISSLRLATVAVLINYVVLLLTISRFWDYEVFVVPLLIPILTGLTAKILSNRNSTIVQRTVLGSWMLLALYLVTIRSGKLITYLESYSERDPGPLLTFVGANVPVNSRVFGPEDYYFYAVEEAGSHYLAARLVNPTALGGQSDVRIDWQEQLQTAEPVYLIWPRNLVFPPGLTSRNLQLIASFDDAPHTLARGSRSVGWASGYPPTNLYRLVRQENTAFPTKMSSSSAPNQHF